MINPPLDSSTWVSVASHTSPPGIYGQPVLINLTTSYDVLLLTVAIAEDKDWVRGGWIYQIWERGNDPYLIRTERIYLNTSLIFLCEPLASSNLVYRPETWIKDYTLTIEGREYLPQ